MSITKTENIDVNESSTKTNSIEQVRYGCAIGAVHSAFAIPRVIPIAHCGPGCVDKQTSTISFYNGFQGGGYGGGSVIPSSNIYEKEVIFGGEDKLRKLIESSFKVLDADLFVVMTGCIPDTVGDDVGAVVSEFQDKGLPVVYAETGGFKGNNFIGHELVTEAIIDQYVGDYKGPLKKGLVNVWSLLPYHNTFWRGDLAEIKRILEGVGLEVNILFGHESGGVSEWQNIKKAQFNLVLSPWLGLKTAEHLKEKYGQPYLHIPTIPIGAKETSSFLRKVVDFAGINKNKAEEFIEREERKYYEYLEDFSDFYAEYWWGLPAKFAVVGDSAYNLAVTKFLINQLGLIPAKQIITDNPPERYRDLIREQYRNIADDVSIDVEFEEDSYIIHDKIRKTDFGHKPPIIFGTTWERDLAKELKGFIVEIGFPASYEVVISKSYVGYRGALTLLEKIYTTIVSASA
ncbi:nitrogenase component 1 [Clostridium autoethanogenum]|uniref:Hydrogenase n=1 Tax=Clostridium autoethanogenum DSM 10061 TaxID=1341692 RepID=A0ABM5NQS3_9CLOT|nr:nitrogenase component 1 [Clostridium autoethanogenum]AGY74644.1 hydrogenase [Clostridium autoethanogenum DSM 10061]ALU34826.1 vnfN-like nitrogenase [Clostridium autoethanogenum DSM 10061]OVY51547.1 Nitrogenase molybdenum-iron protein beta chain [Clostridium autoethanogenum]